MQSTLNNLTTPVRTLAAKSMVALFPVLALCLSGVLAHAQKPIVVSGAATQLGALTGGGWDGSQEPVGGTFVVGVNGNVLVGDGYTSNFLQITPSGTDTVLASGVGASNAALDSFGNLYFGGNYNANVFKLPYNAATGQYAGFTTAPTANCQGGNLDTAACIFAPAVSTFMNSLKGSGGNTGFAGMAFDAQGNFFFESNTLPSNNPNSIFECNLACISSSSATPNLIYSNANPVGAFAIDPWGNIFFVDGNNGTGKVTNLNEIPLSSGVYAASATVVLSYTNAASYSNGISGLAISGTGTLFISDNADGSFAIPNTKSGGPNVAGMFMVSSTNGKGLALDSKGNLYLIPYNGGDVVSLVPMGTVPLGAMPVGTAATAVNATIFDSAGGCTPTLALSVTESGKSTSEFTASAGTTCSTAFGGTNGLFSSGPLTAAGFSSFPVTANFTPTAVGERNAVLTIKDSANSGSGTAMLTGVGQGALGNVDPGVATAYTSGFTSPASVIADAAGDVFVADPSAGKVFEIAAGSSTPVSVGSFTEPEALAFDANGNLFIADNGVPDIDEIPNTGATGAFAAGTQIIVIPSTMVFGGAALTSPLGLAFGPDGTLYISDTNNKRVVSFNSTSSSAGVTSATAANGLMAPMGVAVDASGNLYVADSGSNEVFIFSPAGTFSTVVPPNVTQAVGVAVDASGSVLVADAASGNIVRIPDLSGMLTTASAVTIETVSPQASSLSMDSLGDVYVASASGKAAYAIQRTAAAINLGTVQNGLTNSGAVYLMNAGNSAATLGSPDLTQASNTMFTMAAATNNGCTSGSAGPPGSSCQFTATFAPTVGTSSGPQSGTATIDIATPAVTFNVNMSGTASASSILAQTITGFSPPTSLEAGQQITLSATGGASGNPVIFSIDPTSGCLACAAISGSTLTAVSAGAIKVDANQAGGTANGNQYAAATQVQAPITINNNLVPAGVPAMLMTQVTWLNSTGSFTDGQNPQGGSFAVTQDGEVVVGTTYSNKVYFVNAQTGATISTVTFNGPGGIAIDSKNNLYISHLYNSIVYKIPYVSGAYVTWSDNPTPAPPACTGTDTAECTFANSGQNTKAIAFDPSGNFYMVTEPSSSGSGASAIYECNASCQPAGTGTLLYSDANGISQIAFDPWGDLFFTDANYLVSGASDEGNSGAASSSLEELAFTSGTGFAASPTTLQTFTNTTPGNYDDMLASVAVNSSGTIYYGLLYDGTYAIPNTQANGPAAANQYAVSSQGAKAFTTDSNGNLYVVANHSGADTVGVILVNDLVATPAQLNGAAVNTPATVTDNAFGCGTAATVAIASTNPEFSATAGTTCSSIAVGAGNGTLSAPVASASSYAATIAFQATKPGTQTATLTASDTTNGGEGTATVSGLSLETPQTIAFTAPTTTTYTYSPGMTITVSVSNGPSNNPAAFTVDATSAGAGTFSATTVTGTTSTATLTVSQAGSIVIDANEVGGLVNGIYYYPATQVQLTLTINQASQTIVFPQPLSPVTFSPTLTVSLSANGGASGNPVSFSVDSSSTGAGTISTSTLAGGTSTATLTVTQAGNIVIDANQAGNVDYLAAAPVPQTVVVNQASQAITFIALTQPFHYIAGGVTLPIQATGGGSNSAIVFTVDKSSTMTGSFSTSTVSGATSTATLTVPTQTVTSGTIVVDATQPGNTNYTASAQSQETITVLSPLPTQTITFGVPQTQVGGTTLTLTATASSGFPVTYTSSTTTVCTVSGSIATFAKVTAAGTCTITASQPGDNLYFAAATPVTVSFTVNPAGQVPAMNLNLSLTSLTIEPGTVGLSQLTLTSQNNFTGSVTFACTGLPTGYTCSFSPNPLTIAPNATGTTTLTVTPPASAAAVRHDFRPLFPATLAVALCFLGIKKRNRLHLLIPLVLLFAGLSLVSACGGTSGSSKTAPVTSTATVTATSGSMQTSATLTVILE